jgi:hypothetical protein
MAPGRVMDAAGRRKKWHRHPPLPPGRATWGGYVEYKAETWGVSFAPRRQRHTVERLVRVAERVLREFERTHPTWLVIQTRTGRFEGAFDQPFPAGHHPPPGFPFKVYAKAVVFREVPEHHREALRAADPAQWFRGIRLRA